MYMYYIYIYIYIIYIIYIYIYIYIILYKYIHIIYIIYTYTQTPTSLSRHFSRVLNQNRATHYCDFLHFQSGPQNTEPLPEPDQNRNRSGKSEGSIRWRDAIPNFMGCGFARHVSFSQVPLLFDPKNHLPYTN